jgi:hypothetical protein
MPRTTGRRVPLSLPRKWVADLMHVCRRVPLIVCTRRMNLADAAALRAKAPDPPSWAALFVKAYATVAARTPVLRRAYIPFPWPHLYEADQSIASVAVARDYEGEPAVFFGLIQAPDTQLLPQLAAHLDEFRTKPVAEVRPFARLIRYTRYPLPVRRFMWWLGMSLSGKHRAKTVGTFGLTVVGSAGGDLTRVISPTATTLTYGPIAPDGGVDVHLHFDHRVLDGLTAAKALAELESALGELARKEVGGGEGRPARGVA